MYNEKRKRQFLSEKKEYAKISNNLTNIFNAAEQREEMYGQDLCEWNSDKIIEFYKYYSTSSISSLVVLNTALREYTTWCMENGMVADNQNHYGEISSEALCKCVDISRLKETVFTRDELLSKIKELTNYTDRFVLLGLFEGIPNSVICDVKLSDLSGNSITLSDGKQLDISEELVRIMRHADEETEYISMTKTEKAFPYVPSDTIIKRTAKAKENVMSNTVVVGSKVRRCARYFGIPTLTIKNLVESGRLHYISEIAKENGITVEEVIKGKKYRKMFEDRYGKVQNLMTYWLTYGQTICG